MNSERRGEGTTGSDAGEDADVDHRHGTGGEGVHVAVVGAYGSAGVAAAQGLADAVGEGGPIDRLTLVDDGDPGGGLCILRGCMPSKEVLSAAAHRYRARHDDRLVGDPPTLDLQRVVERKDDHTANFAAHRRAAVHDLADRPGVSFVHGTARFRDGGGLAVERTPPGERPGSGPDEGRHETDGGTDLADRGATAEAPEGTDTADTPGETDATDAAGATARYDPDYVVVATGSRVNVPDLPGLDEVAYHTSADALDAESLPSSAVVMGFGYVGVELSAYLAEAGVDVTAIEHDERPLDEADPAFGDELLSIYREEFGVDVRTEVSETRVEPITLTSEGDGEAAGGVGGASGGPEGVRLHLDDGSTVEAEALFAFTGRRPNVDRLDLGAVGLVPDPGWVDDTMRARDDGSVFVVGDANGKEPILHVAKEQGFLAAENVLAALRGGQLAEYHPLHHHVVFSGAGVYPYVRVGHSAASAAAAGMDVRTYTRRASDDGVFKTKAATRGLARLVVGVDGTVLGYQGLHYHADVMAKTMQVVIESDMDVRDVPDRSYHPTTPEIIDGLVRAAVTDLDAT
jgi:dihydrolipoamide dehydrogenase